MYSLTINCFDIGDPLQSADYKLFNLPIIVWIAYCMPYMDLESRNTVFEPEGINTIS